MKRFIKCAEFVDNDIQSLKSDVEHVSSEVVYQVSNGLIDEINVKFDESSPQFHMPCIQVTTKRFSKTKNPDEYQEFDYISDEVISRLQKELLDLPYIQHVEIYYNDTIVRFIELYAILLDELAPQLESSKEIDDFGYLLATSDDYKNIFKALSDHNKYPKETQTKDRMYTGDAITWYSDTRRISQEDVDIIFSVADVDIYTVRVNKSKKGGYWIKAQFKPTD